MLAEKTLLSTIKLSIGYDNHPIIQDIGLRLNVGDSLLVIGHNGAGKSTLLNTIYGLIPSIDGECNYLNKSIGRQTQANLIKAGIRMLPQECQGFPDLSVAEHRKLFERLHSLPCSEVKSNIPGDRKFGSLSIGEKRKELIYLLLGGDPKLLLLDEPTAGLDIENQKNVCALLKESMEMKTSMIVVEHNFKQFIDIVSQAIIFRQNKVTYYGPSCELKDPNFLDEFFL